MADEKNTRPDPLTGAPGAHPVGVGLGSTGGAAAGAAIGAPAGPIGVVVGAAVGGAIGAVAGRSVAKSINVAVENRYWEENFKTADYVDPKLKYADYEPAYRFGWESYSRYEGRDFEDLHAELQRDWDMHRADSPLTWEKAKEASRAAWRRVSQSAGRDDATLDEGSPTRKPFETNSTMDRGDERS